jgi:hypothetical protein
LGRAVAVVLIDITMVARCDQREGQRFLEVGSEEPIEVADRRNAKGIDETHGGGNGVIGKI